jgi:hypothetical protein
MLFLFLLRREYPLNCILHSQFKSLILRYKPIQIQFILSLLIHYLIKDSFEGKYPLFAHQGCQSIVFQRPDAPACSWQYLQTSLSVHLAWLPNPGAS